MNKKGNNELWKQIESGNQTYDWFTHALKNRVILYWDFNGSIFKTSILAYLEENIGMAKSHVRGCGQKIVKDIIIDGIYYCETNRP